MRAGDAAELVGQLLVGAALAEPVLIVSLTLLCAGRRLLHALRYPAALAAVVALELVLAWALGAGLGAHVPGPGAGVASPGRPSSSSS